MADHDNLRYDNLRYDNLVERWLTCRLDPGMFSDEIAVTYPTDGRSLKSVFVPRSHVRGTPGHVGEVKVSVVQQGGQWIAVLPSGRRDMVAVAENHLRGS